MTDDTEMLIDSSLDAERVVAIQGAIVEAVDEWGLRNGCRIEAGELLTALLCDVCNVMRRALDDNRRAEMVSDAVDFIMKNAGASAPLVFATWLARHRDDGGLAGVATEGNAKAAILRAMRSNAEIARLLMLSAPEGIDGDDFELMREAARALSPPPVRPEK